MVIDDKTRIKSVTAKYPDMMAEGAAEQFKAQYYDLVERKNKLAERRMEVIKEEQELKEKEAYFQIISELFDVEFEKESIEEIREECNLGIINPTDYRNTNV